MWDSYFNLSMKTRVLPPVGIPIETTLALKSDVADDLTNEFMSKLQTKIENYRLNWSDPSDMHVGAYSYDAEVKLKEGVVDYLKIMKLDYTDAREDILLIQEYNNKSWTCKVEFVRLNEESEVQSVFKTHDCRKDPDSTLCIFTYACDVPPEGNPDWSQKQSMLKIIKEQNFKVTRREYNPTTQITCYQLVSQGGNIASGGNYCFSSNGLLVHIEFLKFYYVGKDLT